MVSVVGSCIMSSLFKDLTPGVTMRQSRTSKVAIKCLDHQNSLTLQSNYGSDGTTTRHDAPEKEGNLISRIIIGASRNSKNNTDNTPMKPIKEAEREARDKAENRSFVLFFINVSSAIYVFFCYFVTFESLLSIFLGVGLTLYFYFTTEGNESWNGTMNWTLVSFAVVTPMSVSIGLAFQRREQALRDIAIFRSCAYQLYLAHASWDWGTIKNPDSGRSMLLPSSGMPMDWLKHSDDALSILLEMADKLCHYLTLPCFSRARHRVTSTGRKEASRTVEVAYRLFDSLLTTDMAKFSYLTEVMKRYGLPANEASRIRQWERFIGEAIEDLRMIKTYRTPQALRSFARIFTIFLPAFYSSDFCQLARNTNSLSLGLAFSVITSLSLTALFESIYILEDPFVAHLTLDGIDVQEELCVLHWFQLINAREVIFPEAPKFQNNNEANKHKNQNVTATCSSDQGRNVETTEENIDDNRLFDIPVEDDEERVSAYSPRIPTSNQKKTTIREMMKFSKSGL